MVSASGEIFMMRVSERQNLKHTTRQANQDSASGLLTLFHVTSRHHTRFLVPSCTLLAAVPSESAGRAWCGVARAVLLKPDVLASRSSQGKLAAT